MAVSVIWPRRSRWTGYVLSLLLLTAVLASGNAAGAASPILVSNVVRGANDMLGIAVTGSHEYVSSGNDGTIAIMDPNGVQSGTITDTAVLSELVVVGSTLYAVATQEDSIHRFDLSQDPPVARPALAIAPMHFPVALVYAGTRLWFTASDQADGGGYVVLGSMKLNGHDVQRFAPNDPLIDWTYEVSCSMLDASPNAPNFILVRGGCFAPFVVYRYSVATTPPTLAGERDSLNTPAAAFSPDGKEVIVDGPAGTMLRLPLAFTSDSVPLGSYDPPGDDGVDTLFAHSIASSAGDGGWIVGLINRSANWEVALWQPGQRLPTKTFTIQGDTRYAFPDGVAMSPDGTTAFAGFHQFNGDHTRGKVVFYAAPGRQRSLLSLKASSVRATFGQTVKLTATLRGGGAGRQIVFRRQSPGKAAQRLSTQSLDADGVATLSIKPVAFATYFVTYAGDEAWGPARSREVKILLRPIVIAKMFRAARRAGIYSVYHVNQTIYFGAHQRPVDKENGGEMLLTFQRFQTGWKTVAHEYFTESDTGWVVIYFRPGQVPKGRWRIRARTSVMTSPPEGLIQGISPWTYFRVVS